MKKKTQPEDLYKNPPSKISPSMRNDLPVWNETNTTSNSADMYSWKSSSSSEVQAAKHPSVEEFSVVTISASGFSGAAAALRLPFGNRNKPHGDAPFTQPVIFPSVWMYDADIKLISTLVKRGPEHAKVLRGVVVWCEINAPRYFWQEMATYRIGCECLSSESTMHIEGKGLDEDALVEMKEHLEEGHMQKRVWMFSYQTLRRIYFQRRNHRLPQWRKFCDWIKTLPFAEEFITIE